MVKELLKTGLVQVNVKLVMVGGRKDVHVVMEGEKSRID